MGLVDGILYVFRLYPSRYGDIVRITLRFAIPNTRFTSSISYCGINYLRITLG